MSSLTIPQVVDVVATGNNINTCEDIHLTILGEPHAQNGWKIWLADCHQPVVYDPCSKGKRQLRKAIAKAIDQHLGWSIPANLSVFPDNCQLRLVVVYRLRNIGSKDLDNMSKFLFDALEGIIYKDDAQIVKATLEKKQLTTLVL